MARESGRRDIFTTSYASLQHGIPHHRPTDTTEAGPMNSRRHGGGDPAVTAVFDHLRFHR
ncbi:hypothetical protein AB0K20_09200 [Micromonospora matsumotoense]|uniref:hypothetical protein n=1 Tax=Micromonospora matsumotoense TaxID=121616 RepID=UPI0034362BEB